MNAHTPEAAVKSASPLGASSVKVGWVRLKWVFVLNKESSLQTEQSINVMEQKETICSAQNIFKKAVKAMSNLEMHYTFQRFAMARTVAMTTAAHHLQVQEIL